MKWFIVIMLITSVLGQTQSPTSNVTVPDVATLRPTVPTDSPTPGSGPTKMPTVAPEITSGEPDRVVTVAVTLVLMVGLTVVGICLVANGGEECKQYEPIEKTKIKKINAIW
jgi:hypothetical protein